MPKRILFFLLFVCVFDGYGQYTRIINSRRPGFSESPYSVGTNVFQVEGGLYYRNSERFNALDKSQAFGTNIFLRYGKLLERLEFNVNIAFQNEKGDLPLDLSYDVTGLSELLIGAKFLVHYQKYKDKTKEIRSWKARTAFDTKRLIPSVAVFGGG